MDEKKIKIDNYVLLEQLVETMRKNKTEDSAPYLIMTAKRDNDGFCAFSGNGKDRLVFFHTHLVDEIKSQKKKGFPKTLTAIMIRAMVDKALDDVYKGE